MWLTCESFLQGHSDFECAQVVISSLLLVFWSNGQGGKDDRHVSFDIVRRSSQPYSIADAAYSRIPGRTVRWLGEICALGDGREILLSVREDPKEWVSWLLATDGHSLVLCFK